MVNYASAKVLNREKKKCKHKLEWFSFKYPHDKSLTANMLFCDKCGKIEEQTLILIEKEKWWKKLFRNKE